MDIGYKYLCVFSKLLAFVKKMYTQHNTWGCFSANTASIIDTSHENLYALLLRRYGVNTSGLCSCYQSIIKSFIGYVCSAWYPAISLSKASVDFFFCWRLVNTYYGELHFRSIQLLPIVIFPNNLIFSCTGYYFKTTRLGVTGNLNRSWLYVLTTHHRSK